MTRVVIPDRLTWRDHVDWCLVRYLRRRGWVLMSLVSVLDRRVMQKLVELYEVEQHVTRARPKVPPTP